jgi:hypothetical protein
LENDHTETTGLNDAKSRINPAPIPGGNNTDANMTDGNVMGQIGAGEPRPYGQIHLETGQSKNSATNTGTGPQQRRVPLGQMAAFFKYQTTKRVNERRGASGKPLWQRNYYEHVIRDEESLLQIREYVANNPLRWELDDENPKRQNTCRLQRIRR